MRILAHPAFCNRHENPYNWLLYTEMTKLGAEVCEHSRWRLLTGRYDIWHLHWPEAPLNDPSAATAMNRLGQLIALMEVARRRGTRIVWTVHNLAAHEEQHPRLASWFWKAFIPRLDGYISLTAAGHALALEQFPGLRRLPAFIVPLGHFRGVYPNESSALAVRERLNLEPDATVVSFVGQIRTYKGVTALIDVFRELRDDRATLLIAGDPHSPDIEAAVRDAARKDPRVRLTLGFVPDRDLELYVKAADLLVFPFREVLNSASAMLALSFDRPILVPAKSTLRELQTLAGEEWVHTYEGSLTVGRLRDALHLVRQTSRLGRPRLDSLERSALAARTLQAFHAILGVPMPETPRGAQPARRMP